MADRLCDEILAGTYADDDRVPSVREYAVALEVNTNTAVKAYETLARDGVIYNRRGLGYFVTPGARATIMEQRRRAFLGDTLPAMLRNWCVSWCTNGTIWCRKGLCYMIFQSCQASPSIMTVHVSSIS